MAKFCGKCGTKIDQSTGLCPKCDSEKLKKADDYNHSFRSDEEGDYSSISGLSKKEMRKFKKKEKRALKKAAKKAKRANWSLGKKIRRFFLKILVWVGLLAVILCSLISILVYFGKVDFPIVLNIMEQVGVQVENNEESDKFSHLTGTFTDILVVNEQNAIEVAQEAVKILKLGNAADELTVNNINSIDGVVYYRLQQNYKGIPIIGKTMVVIAKDSGEVLGFTTNAEAISDGRFETSLNHEQIVSNIKIYLIEKGYIAENDNVTVETYSDENKSYYELGNEMIPVYVLKIYLNNSLLSFTTATVNAQSGEVLEVYQSTYEKESIVYNANRTITVDGYFDEQKKEYQLYDSNRGIYIYSYENTDSTVNGATQTFITSINDIFGDTEEERVLEQEKGIRLLSHVALINDYYKEVMGWDGYEKNYFYYNDAYDSGKNALGGNASSLDSGEVVGYLSMGNITGVDALDTVAHEFTHIVSRKNVEWKSVEKWSEQIDESGAINEGYSDIFGEILEGYLREREPDWIHGDRNIRDPMSQNYPACVGDKDYKKFSSDEGVKWGMSIGGNRYTDYSHGFSTIVSHCAYLMSNGVNNTCESIDLYNLSRLWYNTMLTLPSNCTFVVLRENMELTATILGFSETQRNCISAAFEKVGIQSQENSNDTYSTTSTLFILDKNGEIYGNCIINISGNKYRGLFKTGLWKEIYNQEIQVFNTEPVELNLPKGDYVISVTDNSNQVSTVTKNIKVRPDEKQSEIVLATNFGDKSVVQVINNTRSDERDIVLVLDTSGSMSGTPMTETKKASVNFINSILNEDACIGIVAYNNSASMLSDFSVNKKTLTTAVSSVYDGGGTNIEAGLKQAYSMLSTGNAKKKIIVLMSDGEPNDGLEGEELIQYANEIKESGTIIYTLGFFESLDNKSYAQYLMENIASDGCHYEVANADELVFFFEDMADQINGQKYIYVRIACPVDVSVTYNGETLDSSESNSKTRTSFGTLTFEENHEEMNENMDDKIKVLRLKEGVDYDLELTGTGHGVMNYTIGFMDDNGDYSDLRKFENIKITRKTKIDTVATYSDDSVLNIDDDGDGKYDLKLRAEANGYGEEVKTSYWIIYVIIGAVVLLFVDIIAITVYVKSKRRRKGE